MAKTNIIVQLEQRLKAIAPDVIVDWTYVERYKKYSEWSRQIVSFRNYSQSEALKAIFDLEIPNWDTYFKEATSGNGNEINRIMTLHSSALLPLLCFSQVSSRRPLCIDGIKYTEVFFEVKNHVFYSPSNVDVVLKSAHGDLLFLESKFTEYLEVERPKIKESYFEFYHHILTKYSSFPIVMQYPCVWEENGKRHIGFTIKTTYRDSKDSLAYCAGIKQCFSHLIGIAKVPSNSNSDCWRGSERGKLTFSTILYRFGGEPFKIYQQLYEDMIGKLSPEDIGQALNGDCNNSNIERLHILKSVLTYQELFATDENIDFLNEKVKSYYNL